MKTTLPINGSFLRSLSTALALSVGLLSQSDAATLRVPMDVPTIQEAIDLASAGDVILVGPGTWTEPLDLRGKDVILRSEAGAGSTILDGSTHQASILTVTSGETLSARVEGFTFRNGTGTFTAACSLGGYLGGAVFILDSGLTIVDCRFENNGRGEIEPSDWTISGGGAIFACEADIDVIGSFFESNRAGYGGAIRFAAVDRTVNVMNSEFRSNRSAHGGAIQFVTELQSIANVSHSTFDGDESVHGGSIRASVRDRSRLRISDSTIANSVAAFGGGVNINVDRRGVAELDRVVFTGNEAGFGGGLFTIASGEAPAWPGGRLEVRNSHFIGNIAHPCCTAGLYSDPCFEDGGEGTDQFYGGGVDLRTISGGFITFTNTLLARNEASRAGGVHASSCDGGTIRFQNTTVVDNAPSGIHRRLDRYERTAVSPGSIDIASSVLWSNGVSSPLEILDQDLTATATFSNVEGGHEGTGNIDVVPTFVAPENCDYRLAAGSAGIDAGTAELYPSSVASDLAGAARFVDDPEVIDTGAGPAPVIDIGAHERQPGSTSSYTPPCTLRWSERAGKTVDEDFDGYRSRRRAAGRPTGAGD